MCVCARRDAVIPKRGGLSTRRHEERNKETEKSHERAAVDDDGDTREERESIFSGYTLLLTATDDTVPRTRETACRVERSGGLHSRHAREMFSWGRDISIERALGLSYNTRNPPGELRSTLSLALSRRTLFMNAWMSTRLLVNAASRVKTIVCGTRGN